MSSTLWFSTLQGNHLALCWFFPFSRVSYLITKEGPDLWLVPNFLTPFPGAVGGGAVPHFLLMRTGGEISVVSVGQGSSEGPARGSPKQSKVRHAAEGQRSRQCLPSRPRSIQNGAVTSHQRIPLSHLKAWHPAGWSPQHPESAWGIRGGAQAVTPGPGRGRDWNRWFDQPGQGATVGMEPRESLKGGATSGIGEGLIKERGGGGILIHEGRLRRESAKPDWVESKLWGGEYPRR